MSQLTAPKTLFVLNFDIKRFSRKCAELFSAADFKVIEATALDPSLTIRDQLIVGIYDVLSHYIAAEELLCVIPDWAEGWWIGGFELARNDVRITWRIVSELLAPEP